VGTTTRRKGGKKKGVRTHTRIMVQCPLSLSSAFAGFIINPNHRLGYDGVNEEEGMWKKL